MKIKIIIIVTFMLCLPTMGAYGAEPLMGMMDQANQAYRTGNDAGAAVYYQKVLDFMHDNKIQAPRTVFYVRYRLGKIQLRQNEPATALENMEGYYRLKSDDPRVAMDYALALFFTNQYQEAISVFETAARNRKFEPAARYYIVASEIALGNISEGKKELKKVQAIAPGLAGVKNADEFLANLEKLEQEISAMEKQAAVTTVPGRPTKQKPWAVSLSAGLEYDSNVALIPSEQTRPSDISSDGDWRAVYSLGGIYEFINTGKNFVGVTAGVYGTQQFKDDMFNVQNGALSLYYKGNFADTFQVRFIPFVSQTLLKVSSYSWAYGITPGVSWQPVHWTWTDLNYTYTKSNFTDASQYPEENRSGKNHNVNLRQNFSFPSLLIAKRNTFFAGWLNYAKADTDGSSYANHTEGFGVLGQQEFPQGFSLWVSYGYTKTLYENANIRSATNEKRDDTSHIVTANVFKKLDMFYKNLSAYVGYRWFKNDSNIASFYTYTSNTYSVGMNLDF